MTALSLVQDFCRLRGLPVPSTLVGAPDSQTQQMLALLNELGQEQTSFAWQVLAQNKTWSAPGTESLGTLQTLFGDSFNFIVNKTFWNNTLRRPIYGPIQQSDWQILKAFPAAGPIQQCIIFGGELRTYPVVPAGHTLSVFWISKNWVLDPDGSTTKPSITDDADTFLLDEQILSLGLVWRWLSAKGLPYAEEMRKYDDRLADRKQRDGMKPQLYLDPPGHSFAPGIFVPRGNWPVS